MNLRKHRNLLFWFISVFQIILLALPLGDVAKRVIEYQLQPTYYTTQTTTGEPLQSGGYARSFNNALWFSYYDFHQAYDFYDNFYPDAWDYRSNVIQLSGTYSDCIDNGRLYSYLPFDFIFINDVFYDLTHATDIYESGSDSIIQILYLNWYLNYILSILVLTFVPSLVVYIYSWFTELGYLALPRRKENEK